MRREGRREERGGRGEGDQRLLFTQDILQLGA